jgi:D-lactate dehydrogenase (cytochrome)
MRANAAHIEAVRLELTPHLGPRVSAAEHLRKSHAGGESFHTGSMPDLVVQAASTEDVVRVVNACRNHGVPLIPFGAGTSLEGQLDAAFGGVSLDLSGMNAVLEINDDDLDCRVEAGVTREQLNAALRDRGLFFPLDPGANATLGGMAATRASGTNAVRYGTMAEATLGLLVVTPSGEIVRTGGRARKSAAGYDLTRLYIGSEGTLGIITELQLRLSGVPEKIVAGLCQFPRLDAAVSAVTHILQHGIGLARIELLDRLQMRACIAYSKLEDLTDADTLFLEFHGGPQTVAEQVTTVADICVAHGGSALQYAETAEARTKLWTARHKAYWAGRSLMPGCESFATDACVPISRLTDCIMEARAAAESVGLNAPIVGHVGDGNFHMLVLYDPSDVHERRRANTLCDRVAEIALAHGGTISGEHGIGLHKKAALLSEHGAGVGVMALIKQALDPLNIMNPGKMLPDPPADLQAVRRRHGSSA